MSNKIQTATFKLLDVLVILTMVFGAPLNVFAAPRAQTESPALVSDKLDYAPGESAHITGSGFTAGEYVLAANGPDGPADWGPVTADGAGSFAAASPPAGFRGNVRSPRLRAGLGRRLE